MAITNSGPLAWLSYGVVSDHAPTGDVEAGVTYRTATLTGTFTVPAVGDVRLGTGYGDGGVEFIGTYAGGAAVDTRLEDVELDIE